MTLYRASLILLVTLSVSIGHAMQQQALEQTKPSAPPATKTNDTARAAAGAQNRRRSMSEIVAMPVVYRVPGMDQVKVQKDLKYTSTTNPNLLMDVYIKAFSSQSSARSLSPNAT